MLNYINNVYPRLVEEFLELSDGLDQFKKIYNPGEYISEISEGLVTQKPDFLSHLSFGIQVTPLMIDYFIR